MSLSTRSTMQGQKFADIALHSVGKTNQDTIMRGVTNEVGVSHSADPSSSDSLFASFFLLTCPLTAATMKPSTSNTSNASSLAGGCLLRSSLINHFIIVSDNQIRLFYFILGHSKNSASVKIEKDGMVEDLHNAIIEKEGITDQSQLLKVNPLSILT
jgi:hypothetical protein